MRLGSSIAVVGRKPAAAAPIYPLAWEFPYAVGAAIKKISLSNSLVESHNFLEGQVVWVISPWSNKVTWRMLSSLPG